jgi:hypothetical protein
VTVNWRSDRALIALAAFFAVVVPASLALTAGERFYNNPIWTALHHTPIFTFLFVTGIVALGTPRKRWHLVNWRGGLLIYVLVALVAGNFRSAKLALIWTVPYTWDPLFASLDAALHGQDPWRWFTWIYASPTSIWIIDALYIGWITLQLAVTYTVGFWPASPLRTQYLLTYTLLWIGLGVVAAGLLGSVGPCYYGDWTGDSARFGELMSSLNGHRLAATAYQRMMWAAMESNGWVELSGVSAMPSLHVAIATLMALLAWQTGAAVMRIAGIAWWLAIQVGSVVLGWHYAIDGYVSTLVTLGVWYVLGLAVEPGPLRVMQVRPRVRSCIGLTHSDQS